MTNKVKKVFLVSCVKTKLRHAAPAKDLYISPLFKKSREYVELFNTDWFILSAKHGLLYPDTIIEYYDKPLTDDEQYKWAEWVKSQMKNNLPVDADEIIILASENYYKNLLTYLEENYKKVSILMRDISGYCKRVEWLQEQIRNFPNE